MSINPALRYQIFYTTEDKAPIIVPRSSVVTDSGDIVLIGKNRLEYGEVFNANTLHLLEKFACPENPNNPGTPDLSSTLAPMLANPTQGQIWYNKTQSKPFVFTGSTWIALSSEDVVAGNSGVLAHGQQLPRPLHPITGYLYSYDECSWVVSPYGFSDADRVRYLECYTDNVARVFMRYRTVNDNTLRTGYAVYQIIGIKDTSNNGVPFPTPNIPGLTPTPTPTPTMTPTRTPSPTATRTPTPSRTPGPTVTASATRTLTPTPTPLPSSTMTPTPTTTRTPTVTPSVTPSRVPQWSQVDEECELLPWSSNTGQPCDPIPDPSGCTVPTLGTQTTIVSECYLGAGQMRRCTRTYECAIQDICTP